MDAQDPKSLESIFTELRQEDPALDGAVRDTECRRQLALQLTRLRRAAGVSQSRFAQQLGWPVSEVSRLESTLGDWPSEASLRAYVSVALRHAGGLDRLEEVVAELIAMPRE